jgi:hypothetical protein
MLRRFGQRLITHPLSLYLGTYLVHLLAGAFILLLHSAAQLFLFYRDQTMALHLDGKPTAEFVRAGLISMAICGVYALAVFGLFRHFYPASRVFLRRAFWRFCGVRAVLFCVVFYTISVSVLAAWGGVLTPDRLLFLYIIVLLAQFSFLAHYCLRYEKGHQRLQTP